jgi:hypothetical protein
MITQVMVQPSFWVESGVTIKKIRQRICSNAPTNSSRGLMICQNARSLTR